MPRGLRVYYHQRVRLLLLSPTGKRSLYLGVVFCLGSWHKACIVDRVDISTGPAQHLDCKHVADPHREMEGCLACGRS